MEKWLKWAMEIQSLAQAELASSVWLKNFGVCLTMSKYEPLWKYLKENNKENYKLSYEEIKNILGFDIDHSFLTYKKELKEYGYEVSKISMKEKTIIFNKI